MKTAEIPKDGLEGLKQNWTSDAISGFLVFLLALPLSLGIAKASQFPAAMGVLTAMIGGLVVSAFMGGRMTIKGPAAGLITVCSGAVGAFKDLGFGDGVQVACAAVLVMAVIQFIFGVLKFGSYSDFFPHAAVHGMLAAIGILIFAKQFPILLGTTASTKGLTPIQLYTHIPEFIANATPNIALIGILSLVLLFGLPALGGRFKKIPAPMVVLVVMIPLGIFLNFKSNSPGSLVVIGDFWKDVKWTPSFAAIGTGVFWKFVVMFLFVNSLESLLTVKAMDGLDPFKRKSDYNKDLRALAMGNGVSGALGGLPMISEVARSSANVGFGGRTRWSNFFHGLFLFIAMLFMIPLIEMIPNAALAAMLIFVSYRLANPKEFIGTYKIGPEQLVIFLTTIIITVAEDLLMGVAAGIVVKFIFHIINGAPIGSLFSARYDKTETREGTLITVRDSAIFSNFLGYKKVFASLEPGKKLIIDFSNAKLVDHTFLEALHHFEDDYHLTGGTVTMRGLENFKKFSSHPLAARKQVIGGVAQTVQSLDERQLTLQDFAKANQYSFNPQKVRNPAKYKDFPMQKGNTILYEENTLVKSFDLGKVEISDMTLTEGARHTKDDTHITILHVLDTRFAIPNFALEPEGLGTKFSELISGKDIDFKEHPGFSNRYYLRGENEAAVRQFFNEKTIRFLESQEDMHIECHNNTLVLYKRRDLLDRQEISIAEKFAEDFVHAIHTQKTTQTA